MVDISAIFIMSGNLAIVVSADGRLYYTRSSSVWPDILGFGAVFRALVNSCRYFADDAQSQSHHEQLGYVFSGRYHERHLAGADNSIDDGRPRTFGKRAAIAMGIRWCHHGRNQ